MREMKNSGIEWIGDIPSDWNYCKLKSYFDFEKGKNAALYTQEYIGEHIGEFPVYSGQTENNGIMGTIDTFDYDIEKCLFTTTVGAKVMTPKILKGKFNLSQNCLFMRAKKTCSIEFFYYALLPLFSYKKSLIPSYMQPSLRIEDLKTYGFFVPNISQQKKIADFLDGKCAEIDTVIEKTKATIEEYKKLKQSVITQAVTKGIRPNRPMKSSGVEWIGEIPSEWKTIKAKWLLSERKERSINGDEEPLSMSQKLGLIPTKDMDMIPNMASTFVGAKLVYQGDLVFNKLKAHLGVFAVSKYEGLVSPDYAVYFSNDLVRVEYLEYLFKTPQYIAEFRKKSSGVGAGLTRLYTDDLFSIYCSLPSIEEQDEISTFISKKCSEIDELIAKKTSLLSELESYKKSLIYEYVTGKKEV